LHRFFLSVVAPQAPEVDVGMQFDAWQDGEEGGVEMLKGQGGGSVDHRDDLLKQGIAPETRAIRFWEPNAPAECLGEAA